MLVLAYTSLCNLATICKLKKIIETKLVLQILPNINNAELL